MPIERAWDYWVRQVEKAGLMPAKAAAKRKAAPIKAKTAAKRKTAKKTSAKKRR
jgi:hypothetical protein